MRFIIPTLIATVFLGCSTGCFAASLTCDAFKQRLRETIDRDGNRVAQISFSQSSTAGLDGDRVYNWDGIINLSGDITCGADGHFGDFSIALDLKDGLKAADFARMAVLAESSVCSLTSSNHDACTSFVQNMFSVSTEQLKKESDRGEKTPGGTCDFFLFDKVDAEFDVSPATMTWTVGPGSFGPMAAEKQALAPERRDADH